MRVAHTRTVRHILYAALLLVLVTLGACDALDPEDALLSAEGTDFEISEEQMERLRNNAAAFDEERTRVYEEAHHAASEIYREVTSGLTEDPRYAHYVAAAYACLEGVDQEAPEGEADDEATDCLEAVETEYDDVVSVLREAEEAYLQTEDEYLGRPEYLRTVEEALEDFSIEPVSRRVFREFRMCDSSRFGPELPRQSPFDHRTWWNEGAAHDGSLAAFEVGRLDLDCTAATFGYWATMTGAPGRGHVSVSLGTPVYIADYDAVHVTATIDVSRWENDPWGLFRASTRANGMFLTQGPMLELRLIPESGGAQGYAYVHIRRPGTCDITPTPGRTSRTQPPECRLDGGAYVVHAALDHLSPGLYMLQILSKPGFVHRITTGNFEGPGHHGITEDWRLDANGHYLQSRFAMEAHVESVVVEGVMLD